MDGGPADDARLRLLRAAAQTRRVCIAMTKQELKRPKRKLRGAATVRRLSEFLQPPEERRLIEELGLGGRSVRDAREMVILADGQARAVEKRKVAESQGDDESRKSASDTAQHIFKIF